MKNRICLSIICLAAFGVLTLRAEQTDPKPADTVAAASNGNEMPLSLYKKLKAHFDHLAGIPTNLLPGIPMPSKEEVEKDLAKDTSANKDVLLKSLGSSQVIHREFAALALQFCGDKAAAVPALGKALNADADDNVRRAAAISLARLKDAASEDALIKGLDDKDDSVRAVSAAALGAINDSRASEPLLKALDNDSAAPVRLQAAQALRKIADPKSLDGLKKALGTEKDENVISAIAAAVRTLMNGNAPELAEVPTPEQQTGQLTKLASDMKSVETMLRDDRHDQAVQVEGSKIEKSLAELIEKLAKCSACSGGSCNKPGEKPGEKPSNGDPKNKQAKAGMQDSKLGGSAAAGATNAAQVTSTADEWSKLPPAQRDELLQAFREDVPERWRKRLEAYFLSVNAEQNRESN